MPVEFPFSFSLSLDSEDLLYLLLLCLNELRWSPVDPCRRFPAILKRQIMYILLSLRNILQSNPSNRLHKYTSINLNVILHVYLISLSPINATNYMLHEQLWMIHFQHSIACSLVSKQDMRGLRPNTTITGLFVDTIALPVAFSVLNDCVVKHVFLPLT